jgi:hypothetical protein
MRVVLGLAGLLGGAVWIGLWAAWPEDEILRNRVASAALLGMTLGFLGVRRLLRPSLPWIGAFALRTMLGGLLLMFLGNAVEYWLLFGLPHQGGGLGSLARGIAWMTFLFGALLLFAASIGAGLTLPRRRAAPTWLGLLFALLLPLTVGLAFVHPGLAATPLAALCAVGLVLPARRLGWAEHDFLEHGAGT